MRSGRSKRPVTVISASGLTKLYRGASTPALDGVGFRIVQGESVALVGQNGSGKTTLMRILAGIIDPDAGAVSVFGRHVAVGESEFRSHIGVLFSGENALYDRLTVRENVHYHAAMRGVPRERAVERIDRFSSLFELDTYLDKRGAALSRGMKQKAALLRAIIHDPDIILLDEPSTGMDIGSRLKLREYLSLLSRTFGKTIIIASHDHDEIRTCTRRVICLKDGIVSADVPVARYLGSYRRYL